MEFVILLIAAVAIVVLPQAVTPVILVMAMLYLATHHTELVEGVKDLFSPILWRLHRKKDNLWLVELVEDFDKFFKTYNSQRNGRFVFQNEERAGHHSNPYYSDRFITVTDRLTGHTYHSLLHSHGSLRFIEGSFHSNFNLTV